jgi:cytochrome c556
MYNTKDMAALSKGAKIAIAFGVLLTAVIIITIVVFLLSSCSSTVLQPTSTQAREQIMQEIANAATIQGEMSDDELEFDF